MTHASHQNPRVLRELVRVHTRLVSVIFEWSWRLGKSPNGWRKANVPIFRKGGKCNTGNCRLISLSALWEEHGGSPFGAHLCTGVGGSCWEPSAWTGSEENPFPCENSQEVE